MAAPYEPPLRIGREAPHGRGGGKRRCELTICLGTCESRGNVNVKGNEQERETKSRTRRGMQKAEGTGDLLPSLTPQTLC